MRKPSGAALFMYAVIAVSAAISAGSFVLYYGNLYPARGLLWVGIVFFMIMYHLWLRIVMGNVSKLFNVHYTQRWFREKAFEKRLYKALRVKKWKKRALTYNPEQFSLENCALESIAHTMTKAELDHWINQLISLSSLLFAILWGEFWIFLVTAAFAMLFDGQFILIQRYNRPRVLKAMQRRARAKSPHISREDAYILRR